MTIESGQALDGGTVARDAAKAKRPTAEVRLQLLLHGPIVAVMLKLALPTTVVLLVQTLVGLSEIYFVSFLGSDALVGISLVFPAIMVMITIASGGIGGGVSSAISRALGAGRRQDADEMVVTALAVAVACGLVFAGAELLAGPALYAALGGTREALAAAVKYANIVFASAVLTWMVHLQTAALRGCGNVIVPAAIALASVVIVPASPALIFGWGPVPALGIAGAADAWILYNALCALALIWYLRRGRGGLMLRFDIGAVRIRHLKAILGIGVISSLGALQSNLTVVLATGIAGLFGLHAIAGYGIGVRLDYCLLPLLFGLGAAVLTLVGANIGAGQRERARRIAWTGALLGAGIAEVIGLAAAFFAAPWAGLFTDDVAIVAASTLYLRMVGVVYGCFAVGLIVYFAGLGAGRIVAPVLAGTARLLVVAGLGYVAVAGFGATLSMLFAIIAAGSIVFALLGAVILARQY
jgi:putative MATE family efflux protein